jgi:hypothetical protein
LNEKRALSVNQTFTMSALRALTIAVLISGCSALNANNSNPKFRVSLEGEVVVNLENDYVESLLGQVFKIQP